MNGPEHYREAERLIAAVESRELTEVVLPIAQVHATLALAAATAAGQATAYDGDETNARSRGWSGVA